MYPAPLPLQQIPCNNTSFSFYFGEGFISPKEPVHFPFPLTQKARRLGIISLFASVAGKLGVKPEPCHYAVCVCSQAVASPSSWARTPCVFYYGHLRAALKLVRLPRLSSRLPLRLLYSESCPWLLFCGAFAWIQMRGRGGAVVPKPPARL